MENSCEGSLSGLHEDQEHKITANKDGVDVNSACKYVPPKKKMRFVPPVKHNVSETIVANEVANILPSTTNLNIENVIKPIPFTQLSCLDLLLLDFDCTDIKANYGNTIFNEMKDSPHFEKMNWPNLGSFDLEYGSANLMEQVDLPFYDEANKPTNVPFYDEDKQAEVPFYYEDKQAEVPFYYEDRQADVLFYNEDKKQTDLHFYYEDKQADVSFHYKDKEPTDVPFNYKDKEQTDVLFDCEDNKKEDVPSYREHKIHLDMPFNSENMEQAVNRHLDDRDIKIGSFNLSFSDPCNSSDVYSGEIHKSVPTILSSALMMSFGIEEISNSDLKMSNPDIEAYFNYAFQYENNSLMQSTCKSSYMENEALVFQELLTRKEIEMRAVEEMAQLKNGQELKEQYPMQKMKTKVIKNAIKKKITKTKVNTKVSIKNKKKIAANSDVEKPVKNNLKPKTRKVELQNLRNKNIAMRHFGLKIDKTDMEENGKMKQNTIKMQTVKIRNEKQLAPSEKRVQIHNDGVGKVKIVKLNASLADEINHLRQENNSASELLKKYTFHPNNLKKPKRVPTKKRKAFKRVNEKKHDLEVAFEMIKLLRKISEALHENMWDDKEIMKLFDEFLHVKVTCNAVELLPHFVLTIKCVKDCHAFPSKVKKLACKVHSHMQTMYGIQTNDKLESKYLAIVKKRGKVQSRKARELINYIHTWDDVNFKII